ncbi:MAG: hypothetical protein ABW136_06150 [Steroidobacteraceae bacterium]
MKILATSLLLALGYSPLVCSAAAVTDCDQSGSKSTPSPDGKWIANVQEEVCATATGAAAGITVLLVSAADPAKIKRVFIMAVPREREERAKVRWPANDKLEVRVPNLAESVRLLETAYEGVDVSLTYCGDDPAARASLVAYRESVLQWQKTVSVWAEKRKQDAAAAGPRPPRPEEPRLDRGRCLE